jgi:UDP-N-acetylglucosamine 3-dehydrogenase
MTRSLRVGVIGAGVVAAEIHVPGYKACPDSEILSIASASWTSAERLAQRFGIEHVHKDVRGLLGDPQIDAVSLCTPPDTHRDLAEAAVRAGKHVLVEKPIATSLDDLNAIRRLASESTQVVDVVRNERFMKFNWRVRATVVEGAVGDVLGILQTISTTGPENWSPTATWFRDPVRAGGGAVVDLAVHKADLAGWITGRPLLEGSPHVIRDDPDIEEH